MSFLRLLGISACAGVLAVTAFGEHLQHTPGPKTLPTLKVRTLDGKALSPESWRGKVVVVNFWATWCGPCQAEVPDFVALQTKYREQVQFVGLAYGEASPDSVREFANKHKVNYPIALVDDDVAELFGGIEGLPTTFIADKDGHMIGLHRAAVSRAAFERELRSALGLR